MILILLVALSLSEEALSNYETGEDACAQCKTYCLNHKSVCTEDKKCIPPIRIKRKSRFVEAGPTAVTEVIGEKVAQALDIAGKLPNRSLLTKLKSANVKRKNFLSVKIICRMYMTSNSVPYRHHTFQYF